MGCWENLLYAKSKSPYCQLHQKIIKNSVLDQFMKLALKFTSQEWDLFTYDLIKSSYKIKIGDLLSKLDSYKGIKFSNEETRNLWECYKLSDSESGLAIEERTVMVKDLVGTKMNRKHKRIDELIQLQQSEDKKVSDKKLFGL